MVGLRKIAVRGRIREWLHIIDAVIAELEAMESEKGEGGTAADNAAEITD